MLSLPGTRIFLVAGPTDLRKGFRGLPAIVQNEVGKDPLSGQIFLFSNRKRNCVKVLYWDSNGYWVCSKRLQKGTFSWPEVGGMSLEMTREELVLLLGGIDLSETKRRRWYRRVANA